MSRIRYWILIGAVLSVMAAAGLWLFTVSFPELDKKQPDAGAALGAVDAKHEIVQTFVAPEDRISRVELVLNKIDPTSGGSLRLQIVEFLGSHSDGTPSLGNILSESRLDTGTFDYLGGHRFDFDQLSVTPGSQYALRLVSDNPPQAGVSPFGTEADAYKDGRLYKDGYPVKGDLYFEIYHSTGIAGLLAKNEAFRPWPLKRAIFFEGLFVAGAGLVGLLLWEMAASGSAPKRGKTGES